MQIVDKTLKKWYTVYYFNGLCLGYTQWIDF